MTFLVLDNPLTVRLDAGGFDCTAAGLRGAAGLDEYLAGLLVTAGGVCGWFTGFLFEYLHNLQQEQII